jgi:hypothetical protein
LSCSHHQGLPFRHNTGVFLKVRKTLLTAPFHS